MIKKSFEIEFSSEFIASIMGNFPEAGLCLTCISFDYEAMEFEFWDHDSSPEDLSESIIPCVIQDLNLRRSGFVKDAVTYKLSRKEIEHGFSLMLDQVIAGKLDGLGLTYENIKDAGYWDACCADSLVQCAIFGEVIYG